MKESSSAAVLALLGWMSVAAVAQPLRRLDAGGAAPALTLNPPSIEIGNVTPDDPPGMVRALVTATVVSALPWSMELLLNADPVAAGAPIPFPAEKLFWRFPGDRFRPFVRQLPIILEHGAPTPPQGQTLRIEVGVDGSWAVSPGTYTGALTLALDTKDGGSPSRLTADCKVRLTVLPHARVEVDRPALPSPAVDPTRPGEVTWSEVLVRVLSNSPWTLRAERTAELAATSDVRSLPAAQIGIRQEGRSVPLESGKPLLLASGPAPGAELAVTFFVRLAGGEPAGSFRLPVRFVIEPASANLVRYRSP